jgi:hypothetical protein
MANTSAEEVDNDPFELTPEEINNLTFRLARLPEIAQSLKDFAAKVDAEMVDVVCNHAGQTWGGMINNQSAREMAAGIEFLPALLIRLAWNIEEDVRICRTRFVPGWHGELF